MDSDVVRVELRMSMFTGNDPPALVADTVDMMRNVSLEVSRGYVSDIQMLQELPASLLPGSSEFSSADLYLSQSLAGLLHQ